MSCCSCCCHPGECCGPPGEKSCCKDPRVCCGTGPTQTCCFETEFCCGEGSAATCCPDGEVCCAEQGRCCPENHTCCGTEECCPPDTVCCDGICCLEGECCVDGYCVACDCDPPCTSDNCEECVEDPPGTFNCESTCAGGEYCCDGVCQAEPCCTETECRSYVYESSMDDETGWFFEENIGTCSKSEELKESLGEISGVPTWRYTTLVTITCECRDSFEAATGPVRGQDSTNPGDPISYEVAPCEEPP